MRKFMNKKCKYLTLLLIIALVSVACGKKQSTDIFDFPDNERLAKVDTNSVFHVAVKQITDAPGYHWFAYYDKLQCDPSGRYVLSMQTSFEHRSPLPEDTIIIGIVDLKNNCKWIELGSSRAWGWQQGCQLQFIPGSKNEVLWNDREGDKFVCRIVNIETGERRTIPMPIYAVSPNGEWAVTTDYRRVNDTRPGYGYAGIPDPYANELAPDSSGIWKVDLKTGEAKLLISIAQVARMANSYDTETKDAKHWFNHLLVNPDGTRFIFLHRWRYPDAERTAKYLEVGGWGTRMLTASMDGSDIRIIDPYNYTSHFIWKDKNHILAWTELPEQGEGFFLFKDSVIPEITHIGKGVMTRNGHCTYLPHNTDWIVNDTYPDENQLQSVYIYHEPTNKRYPLAELYSPELYAGEWRCDTHPRTTPDGKAVIVDSPNYNGRQLYMLSISDIK